MNGAEWLVRALEAEGVDTLFGYPGGCIMPFYDALLGSTMHHVLVRHEQAAALAANGYARHSGRVGVCVATSGPGASSTATCRARSRNCRRCCTRPSTWRAAAAPARC
jgi:acetolactate synthase-1/2/3 large subunit